MGRLNGLAVRWCVVSAMLTTEDISEVTGILRQSYFWEWLTSMFEAAQWTPRVEIWRRQFRPYGNSHTIITTQKSKTCWAKARGHGNCSLSTHKHHILSMATEVMPITVRAFSTAAATRQNLNRCEWRCASLWLQVLPDVQVFNLQSLFEKPEKKFHSVF